MPELSREESLRILALEQAVEAAKYLIGESPKDLAVDFYDFLTGASDKPQSILLTKPEGPTYDTSGYTYWQHALSGVILRTKDGDGPDTPAQYWPTSVGDWANTSWATWTTLSEREDWSMRRD